MTCADFKKTRGATSMATLPIIVPINMCLETGEAVDDGND